jgi:hypothetical protein
MDACAVMEKMAAWHIGEIVITKLIFKTAASVTAFAEFRRYSLSIDGEDSRAADDRNP